MASLIVSQQTIIMLIWLDPLNTLWYIDDPNLLLFFYLGERMVQSQKGQVEEGLFLIFHLQIKYCS